MATYGEIRGRLAQLFPGIELDLWDGWIADRYQQILDALNWQRLDVVQTLQTEAEYNTGTLDATLGSTVLAGTGTAWVAGMSVRILRIASRPEFYGFTYVGATSGTLDRAFEGETDTGLSYRLNRNVFALSSDTRYVQSVESFETGLPLIRCSVADLNRMDAARTAYGDPTHWAPYMDASTTPPSPQIELWPIPTGLKSLRVQTVTEAVPFAGATAAGVLPWVRPQALIEGCSANARRHEKDVASAREHESQFGALVMQMAAIDAQRVGPVAIRQPERYTRHRARRWNR